MRPSLAFVARASSWLVLSYSLVSCTTDEPTETGSEKDASVKSVDASRAPDADRDAADPGGERSDAEPDGAREGDAGARDDGSVNPLNGDRQLLFYSLPDGTGMAVDPYDPTHPRPAPFPWRVIAPVSGPSVALILSDEQLLRTDARVSSDLALTRVSSEGSLTLPEFDPQWPITGVKYIRHATDVCGLQVYASGSDVLDTGVVYTQAGADLSCDTVPNPGKLVRVGDGSDRAPRVGAPIAALRAPSTGVLTGWLVPCAGTASPRCVARTDADFAAPTMIPALSGLVFIHATAHDGAMFVERVEDRVRLLDVVDPVSGVGRNVLRVSDGQSFQSLREGDALFLLAEVFSSDGSALRDLYALSVAQPQLAPVRLLHGSGSMSDLVQLLGVTDDSVVYSELDATIPGTVLKQVSRSAHDGTGVLVKGALEAAPATLRFAAARGEYVYFDTYMAAYAASTARDALTVIPNATWFTHSDSDQGLLVQRASDGSYAGAELRTHMLTTNQAGPALGAIAPVTGDPLAYFSTDAYYVAPPGPLTGFLFALQTSASRQLYVGRAGEAGSLHALGSFDATAEYGR